MEKQKLFIDELKPALFFARAMGLAPYTIVDKKIKLSRLAIFYSLIINLIYVHELYHEIVQRTAQTSKSKLSNLKNIRAVIPTLSLLVSFVCSLLHHRKFSAFVTNINNFDDMINPRPSVTKNRAIAILISPLLPIVFFSSGRILYSCFHRMTFTYLRQDLKYLGFCANLYHCVFIISCIYRRFQEIKRAIDDDPQDLEPNGKFLRRFVGIREVWGLYGHLIDATEELNSLLSVLFLMCICTLPINVITRIHDITSIVDIKIHEVGVEIALTLMCVQQLISLTGICHLTACEANNVAGCIFRINSRVLRSRPSWENEDTFLMGQYFVIRRYHFTAAGGFVRIDLPLLQTIAAAITTYLVMLKPPDEKN